MKEASQQVDFAERELAARQWRPPLTARSDSWAGWALLIVASGGIAGLLLGLYLAWWIYRLGKRKTPLILYGTFALLCLGPLLPEAHSRIIQWASDVGSGLIALLWFVSAFALRSAVLEHYKKTFGMDLELSRWKTLVFSTLYLNWCLAVYRP